MLPPPLTSQCQSVIFYRSIRRLPRLLVNYSINLIIAVNAARNPLRGRCGRGPGSDGWNVTGDVYFVDDDGYFWFQARADDMIVSAGYNIAGPEVEGALITHPAVKECACVGAPDAQRGQVVKAFIVLNDGFVPDTALIKELQDSRARW